MERYFHVMFDEGKTLTMQQRENTVTGTKWFVNAKGNPINTAGPTDALRSLENVTSGWTNVKDQTYTMGTTVFKTNAYTGCYDGNCTTNTYTMSQRSGKARMITVQEVMILGSRSKGPVWLHNYLKYSTNNGGTETTIDNGYWTMSTTDSGGTQSFTIVSAASILINVGNTASTDNGVRAVVVIDK